MSILQLFTTQLDRGHQFVNLLCSGSISKNLNTLSFEKFGVLVGELAEL